MCMICVDVQLNRMTSREARAAYMEMKSTMTEEHIVDVLSAILEAQVKEIQELNNDTP